MFLGKGLQLEKLALGNAYRNPLPAAATSPHHMTGLPLAKYATYCNYLRYYAAQCSTLSSPGGWLRLRPPHSPFYRPKSPDEIRRNMSAIRATENRTERALRSALHRMGLRFRKYMPGIAGRPDIVFPTQRVAVFVDGDYWHGRVLQEKGLRAFRATVKKKETRTYWLSKIGRNVARDHEVTRALKAEGWLVIRLWESDTKRDVAAAARRVARALAAERKGGASSALTPR